MAETTHPDAGVDAVAQDDVTKMQAYLNKAEPEAPVAEPPLAAAQPEGPADILTEADIPDIPAPVEGAQPQPIEIEIIHEGKPVRLSGDDVVKYARQGFDYTQKTQVLAEASRAAQERLQRAQEIEQVQQALTNDLGVVRALQGQLEQYQGVNWMQLAQDPAQYAQVQAQYNAIQQAYNQAAGQLTAKVDAVKQARAQVQTQAMQQEAARLTDFIPEWKDPAKHETGRQELTQYLQKSATQHGLDISQFGRYLDNAFAVSVVHKAMQYDKLVQAKSDKIKQLRTVPPVTRPGAAQGADATRADRTQQLEARLRKSGDVLDAAALLASRWSK